MQARTFALAVAMSVVINPSALAQQTDKGLYLGLHVGQATIDFDNAATAADLAAEGFGFTPITTDDKDTAWKVLIGYRFHPNFAAEMAYVEAGEFAQRTTLTSLNGTPIPPTPIEATFETKNTFTVSGLGILPLGAFSLYGKLGFYRTKIEVTASAPTLGIVDTESVTSDGVLFGAGVGYDVTKNVTVRGEFERLKEVGDKDRIGESDADFLSIGVIFRF